MQMGAADRSPSAGLSASYRQWQHAFRENIAIGEESAVSTVTVFLYLMTISVLNLVVGFLVASHLAKPEATRENTKATGGSSLLARTGATLGRAGTTLLRTGTRFVRLRRTRSSPAEPPPLASTPSTEEETGTRKRRRPARAARNEPEEKTSQSSEQKGKESPSAEPDAAPQVEAPAESETEYPHGPVESEEQEPVTGEAPHPEPEVDDSFDLDGLGEFEESEEELDDEWRDLEQLIAGKPLDIDALTARKPRETSRDRDEDAPDAAPHIDDDGGEEDAGDTAAEDGEPQSGRRKPSAGDSQRDDVADIPPSDQDVETQAAVTSLAARLDSFSGEMARLDEYTRTLPEETDASTLRDTQEEILELCRQQTAQAAAEVDVIAQPHDDNALRFVCDELRGAFQRHQNQLQGSCRQLETLDYEADPPQCRRQMRTELVRIVRSGHDMQEHVESARIELARKNGDLDSLSPEQQTDPETGLPNRAGLEVLLDQWFREHQRSLRRLTVAGVDLDRFDQINERFGHTTANLILRHVAHLLRELLAEPVVLARTGGQRFFLLFPETDPRTAVQHMERLRQSLEATEFRYRGESIRVTFSAGVTAAAPTDTAVDLHERINASIREAKRRGRNRTLHHDGNYPSPVVPANLHVEDRVVEVSEQSEAALAEAGA